MLTADEIQEVINQKIDAIYYPNIPADLYQPIRYVLSLGGKRVRPILALMACNLFSDEIETAIEPALGLEIFHNFTLVHDDIMDNADKRRCHLTVHRKWSENVAILSGDTMQIQAYQHLAQVPAALLPKILQRFSQTALEVCEGQQLDMDFEKKDDVTQEEYIEMIRLKTAVLLAASLQIGAWIGGSTDHDAQLLYDFGSSIGLAFQLQDDLLDVYGNPETFGKNIGGDIVSNKKTFLLISAMNLASATLKNTLSHWLAITPENPQEKILAVTDIYNALEMKAFCERQVAYFHARAFAAIDALSIPESRKTVLISYVSSLMQRQT